MKRCLLAAALAIACKGEGRPAPKVEDEPAQVEAPPEAAPAPRKTCRVEDLPEEGKRVHVEHLGIRIALPPLPWVIDCEQPALAAVRMEQFGILVRAQLHARADPAAAVADGLDGIVAAWSESGAFQPGPREIDTGADGRARACVSGPGELDGAAHHLRACTTGLAGAGGTTVVHVEVFVRQQAWDPTAEDAKMLLELVDAIATDWTPESG